MRKIIFIRFDNTPFGGAQRYLNRLNTQLQSNGYQTELIFSKLPKNIPSWLKVLLFDRYIQKVTKNRKSDEVIFSLERISYPDIYRAGDGVHRAYLKSKGFSLNPLHLSYLWLEKKTFNNAKIIIANSKMVKSQIIKHYNIDESKIRVIYNGIPLPKKIDSQKARELLEKEFNIDKNIPIILFVGSGFDRKGVIEFLEILSKLKSPYQAFVVGKEKRLSKYKKRAKELGVDKRVIFTGARRDVDIFYDACDIFLFPTHYEPFSNVVLEAMSRASIVFTTRQNGASEILDEDFIMDNPNDISIANSIDKILSDKELIKRIKSKMREVSKRYSIETNANETLKVIENIKL